MKKTDIILRLRWWRTRPFTADTYDKHDASLRAALEAACDEILSLRNAHSEDTGTPASAADLRERVAELEGALREAALQIGYLHGKFQETGSGNAVLARINGVLEAAK